MNQRTDIDIDHFKKALLEEKKLLEEELGTVAKPNPDVAGDWEPRSSEMDGDAGDSLEVAEKKEQYKENDAILHNLEIRYNNVKRALAKVDDGTYGVCEISGELIEKERLEANPAARTCRGHMEQESELS